MGCASQAVPQVDTVDITSKGPEKKCGIIVVRYFIFHGRSGPIQSFLSHAGVPYEFKPIHPVKWMLGGLKKVHKSLPTCQRADGTWMLETLPMGRYIARHHDMYPSDPLEAFRCDWLLEGYTPLLNVLNSHNFELPGDAKKHKKEVLE